MDQIDIREREDSFEEDGFRNIWYECFVNDQKTRGILFSAQAQADLEEDVYDDVVGECHDRLKNEPRGSTLIVKPLSRKKFILHVMNKSK